MLRFKDNTLGIRVNFVNASTTYRRAIANTQRAIGLVCEGKLVLNM